MVAISQREMLKYL